MPAIYYDVTHLRHFASSTRVSGVIRLDLEIARRLFSRGSNVGAIQYGVGGPSLVQDVPSLQALVAAAIDRRRNGSEADLRAIAAWLKGSADPQPAMPAAPVSSLRPYARLLTPPSWARGQTIENGSIYLNTAQHALAYPIFFRWLNERQDIKSVFLVHDLLPLDYPEYWGEGYRARFHRAIGLQARLGRGFVVTSEVVRERLLAELGRHGRSRVEVLQSTPPVFLGREDAMPGVEVDLGAVPYFVMLGTIEPRKNHLLILNIWRQLVERGGPVPKLVIMGRRGWENEQVLDMLDRSPALRGRVLEVANISDAVACSLISNACGLLFPSFAEGFGLPVAEALAAGTPVVASDIRVLRETSQGKALLLDPLDGPRWSEAILGLADRSSAMSCRARALAATFRPRPAETFFSDLEGFVAQL